MLKRKQDVKKDRFYSSWIHRNVDLSKVDLGKSESFFFTDLVQKIRASMKSPIHRAASNGSDKF